MSLINNKVFVQLPGFSEFKRVLEQEFIIADNLEDAVVCVVEDTSLVRKPGIFLVIGGGVSDDYISVTITDPPVVLCELVKNLLYAYTHSPRKKKVEALKEQNELLAEANKGLVDLYNLIDNKNKQIEFLKNKLENIINSAASSIIELDSDGRIVFVNKMFMDVCGYSCDVAKGMRFLDMFAEEYKAEVESAVSEVQKGVPSEFSGKLKGFGDLWIDVRGFFTVLDDEGSIEVIFEDIGEKLKMEAKVKKLEEKAIVAGFSRHLSHNILNALTVSAGFLKKIKSAHGYEEEGHLWRIVDEKCQLIEEIVTGYNDYTNAISLKMRDEVDLPDFFENLVKELASKDFDKNFSAFLYYFLDDYNISYNFEYDGEFPVDGNVYFLKLSLCYIIKDCIRFFSEAAPLLFNIRTLRFYGRFALSVEIHNVEISQELLDTMCQPWNHQMLSQSFDYWGIVIANVITEKHGGLMHLKKESYGIRIVLEF